MRSAGGPRPSPSRRLGSSPPNSPMTWDAIRESKSKPPAAPRKTVKVPRSPNLSPLRKSP